MRSPRNRRPPQQPPTENPGIVGSLPRITACLRALDVPKQDVRDLAHNVVVTAYGARARFDPDVGSEASWLLGIARLTAKGAKRKARRHGTEPVDFDAVPGPDQVDPHELLRARQSRELLERMLARLRPERRAIIEAKHLAGRSFHEIAAEMGLPFETVRKMERLGWEELEREARRIRARARHRKQDGLPMVLPLLPRRTGVVKPMLVGALGGAITAAVLMLAPTDPTPGAAPPNLSAPAVARASPPEEAPDAAPAPAASAAPCNSSAAPARVTPPTPSSAPREGPPTRREVGLLREAFQAAQTGDVKKALALLEQHSKQYPRSQHGVERAGILRIIEGKRRAHQ